MIETNLSGESRDIVSDNVSKLKEIFPDVITEDKIDFEKLKLILGEDVETDSERYSFTWPGKTQAIKESQKQSTGTLRPCKEESKNWDTTENLYIEGDNLEVLKLLQKSYYGKIKAIYIDPPYNTGNDIIYKNDFSDNLDYYLEVTGQISRERESIGLKLSTNTETNGRFHSNWLNMMYSRIKLARNLLTDDGCMIFAIDHYELNNLINICNEIFGEENKLGIITVVHKPEGRQHAKFFSASNEFMLVYAKNKSFTKFNSVVLSDEKMEEFSEKDEYGNFKWKNFIRGDTTKSKKPKGFYPIYVSKDLQDITLDKKEEYYEIWPIDNKGKERAWIVLPDGFKERLIKNEIKADFNPKYNKVEIFYKIREQQVLTTHWIDKKYNATANGTNILKELMGGKFFDYPKSLYLIEDILRIILDNESIVLDLFSGSATTAHAIMDMNDKKKVNQKFIMVQLPYKTEENSEAYNAGFKNICEIGKERIRRAGDKIVEESGNKDLDIGFKVFKLDNIKSDRTNDDLIYEIMLKYGVDLTLPIIQKENNIYSIGYGVLIVCLEDSINKENIKEIANKIIEIAENSSISRVVFKDSSFNDGDSVKTNIKEIFSNNNINEFITI